MSENGGWDSADEAELKRFEVASSLGNLSDAEIDGEIIRLGMLRDRLFHPGGIESDIGRIGLVIRRGRELKRREIQASSKAQRAIDEAELNQRSRTQGT